MTKNQRIDVYLICNAKFHDTNFARLELLKLLAEHEDVMVRVAEDYRDLDAIHQAQLLITYTCDLCPTPEQQEGLKWFLSNGKRWFALHATNALIGFVGETVEVDGIKIPGKADTPNKAPLSDGTVRESLCGASTDAEISRDRVYPGTSARARDCPFRGLR